MENFIRFYQNIPLHINPIAFKIGFFKIGWYGISYLAAFLVVYSLLKYRIKKEEKNIQVFLLNIFFVYAILGVLVGGRLGYVLFYNLPYYLKNPLEIISLYNFGAHAWTGIYGMSYHGGLIAVILIAIWFCRKNKISFHAFSDFIVPAIPAGYFFGRLGNFLNEELYGRITNSYWGMYFYDGKNIFLRYPSQLIEAFLEGAVIFIILWTFRNKIYLKGRILFLYVFFYGAARFAAEFFRQPDPQLGYLWNWLTLGQILSLVMISGGLLLFVWDRCYNKINSH